MARGICGVIIARNEERRLPGCIDCLRWCDGILVVDSGSTDRTAQVARELGASVVEVAFSDFSSLRNAALDLVDEEFGWVLFVDADERVSSELRDQILATCAADDPEYSAWTLNRRNYLLGRWIRHSGWCPDNTPRLFRRGKVRYGRLVHEEPIVDGKIGSLSGPLDHYSYESVSDMLRKLDLYSDLEARSFCTGQLEPILWRRFPKRAFFHSLCKRIYQRVAFLRPPMLFCYHYFLKLGLLDGYRGFLIAAINGFFHGLVCNAKVWELREKQRAKLARDVAEEVRTCA